MDLSTTRDKKKIMFGRVGGCVRYPKLFYPKGVFLLVMVCFGDSVFFCLNVWMSVFFWNVFWCGLVSVFFLQSWGWFGFSECSNNPLQVLFGSSRIGTIFKLKKIRYKRIFFGKGYSL